MKIIILYLFLILLLFLINKKKISIEKFSTNDQKWIDYRLGDIFYDYPKLYIKKKNKLSYIDNISSKYPNSIGDKYRVETKNLENKGGNFKILKKIIDNEKYETPKENDIILHLRIGDVILGYENNEFIFKKLSNGTQYCIPLKVIDSLLKKLDNNKKIILVYGSHKKGKDKLSQKYIKLTKNLYKEKDKINNLEILTQIIKENSKNIDTPNLNDIVFHIRLGDIIKDFKNNEVIIKKKNWGINLNIFYHFD